MSDINHETPEEKRSPRPVKARYAIPFFVVLALLTVVSFIIPLRPTQSQSEKRNLARFPEFSTETLLSGSYFDDITTWFSDTFPGREGWLSLSSSVQELHGYSDVAIQGDLPISDEIPVVPEAPTAPPVTEPPVATGPEETEAPTEEPPQETVVLQEATQPVGEVEEWGGVGAGEEAEIAYGASTIQIGDTVFNFCNFSQLGSDRYIRMTNTAAASLEGMDVRLVSLPIPTSIGIMVEKEYQEKLNCAPQDDIIDYMHAGMRDDVIKVDLYQTLVDHNDEYLYFRTDHHWTALGAYYAYTEICNALGYEAAPLDSFEEWDMGTFHGSLYGGAAFSSKLTADNVYAYIPQGDIEMMIYQDGINGFSWPLLTDMSNKETNTKYMTFLAGDHALAIVTNNSLPDGPSCVVIKDSYGNPLIPFLTQNYHKVYVIDYRKYTVMKLKNFVTEYEINDVILANNLTAAQVGATNDVLDNFVS